MRLNKSMKHAGIGPVYNVVNSVFLFERVFICTFGRSCCNALTDECFLYVKPAPPSTQFADAAAAGPVRLRFITS
jgi:hypothetical protein